MAHKTYIKEADGADTVVLFIHGFLGSPEHFERFVKLIPDNISVYNVLLNGHGKGVSDFAKASMEEWKKQIREIVSSLVKKYKNIYIAAHSMGTFFAIQSAIEYSDNVKAVFLLQTPLKIGVKPYAVLNTFRSLFNVFNNEVGRAYKNAHSVKLSFRLWEYIGWIPRYVELFKESKTMRSTILRLETPCFVFQSKRDELVSIKSVKYIPVKENITLTVLEHSAHFIYDKDDAACLEKAFCEMLNSF